MAKKSSALTAIVKEAKHLRRKYPNRFKKLRKKDQWSKGYIKQASAIYAKKQHGKSPVGKKKKRKAVGAKRSTPVKRKKPSKARRLVKQVTKRSVERVVAGRRPRRRSHTRRKVRMAGAAPRRRTVGKTGGSGLLIGLAVGAAALYFLTKGSSSSTTASSILPPITSTGNYTRDTQSQQIVNYALAAGLTINAITNLIHSLNSSSDNTVNNVYDKVNTTGSLDNTGLPGFDPIA